MLGDLDLTHVAQRDAPTMRRLSLELSSTSPKAVAAAALASGSPTTTMATTPGSAGSAGGAGGGNIFSPFRRLSAGVSSSVGGASSGASSPTFSMSASLPASAGLWPAERASGGGGGSGLLSSLHRAGSVPVDATGPPLPMPPRRPSAELPSSASLGGSRVPALIKSLSRGMDSFR